MIGMTFERILPPGLSRPRAGALVGVIVAALAAGPGAAEPSGPCSPLQFEGASYVICTFDARRDDIRLFWKGGDDQAYGDFSRLDNALASHGKALRFAMNAGMFEDNLTPVGLYIEDGRQRHRADLREGASNFHLKPNGVFYVGDGAAGVVETARFLADGPKARFATQSGPMLVLDGRIHPKISPSGASAKIRNGVGVRDGAIVSFAISEEPVTFYAFARLFRDGLNCPNALFLDGTISSLYAPNLNRRDDPPRAIGPIVAVTAPAT
ncbi:MAG TPA: phosphodiester glycosidase family protein [Roseiarcus sp.]|nr:phosphodiester glycosidase family protein [Roseiarcus sp.]